MNNPDVLAEKLLDFLASQEARTGHLLYTQHLLAWGEAEGLSTADRNAAADACLARGWLERSEVPVRSAYRLTKDGHTALRRKR